MIGFCNIEFKKYLVILELYRYSYDIFLFGIIL